jgi:RNA polymerase sigma-70 factor, ECF subfamily
VPREEHDVLGRYQRALAQGVEPGATTAEELNALFGAHWDHIYFVCLRFMGDEERAGDLAQDTMLRAFDRLHQYHNQGSFRSWLYCIARSLCFKALKRRTEPLLDDGVVERSSPEASALKAMHRHQREELVRDAIGAVLTPDEQEVFYLRYVEHVPQSRITALLELDPQGGARVILQRCRRKLQRELRRRLAELGHGSSYVRDTV